MGFEERNTWSFAIITLVSYTVYVVLVLRAADGGPLVDAPYQPYLLGTIGAAIVVAILASIAIRISIAVRDREAPQAADQRDREISAFGSRMGQSFMVIGGIAAMLMAMAEWDWFWIANVIYLCFMLSAMTESIARIAAYRGGLPQW
ncbi:MAG: hypothetical protein AB7O74_17445 [Candidatus Nanopelagicales bacterium]